MTLSQVRQIPRDLSTEHLTRRAHTHNFLVHVSHCAHAHSAWLKVKRVRVIFYVFTSISFLDVVVECPLLSFSHEFYPHLPVHSPDLQRRKGVAEKTQAHPLGGVGLVVCVHGTEHSVSFFVLHCDWSLRWLDVCI